MNLPSINLEELLIRINSLVNLKSLKIALLVIATPVVVVSITILWHLWEYATDKVGGVVLFIIYAAGLFVISQEIINLVRF